MFKEEAQIKFIAKLNKVAPTLADWAARKFAAGVSIEEVKKLLKLAADETGRN